MSQEPQTWHYGLMARYWAEFNTGGPEIEYFQRQIERFAEPALDVACGGFGIRGSREDDMEALRRFYQFL